MESIRLILHKNKSSHNSSKTIILSLNLPFSLILSECSKALQIPCTKLFNESGDPITSLSHLQDGSNLYLSEGEPFNKRNSKSQQDSVLALLGSAGVGKSAITLRYIRNLYVKEYDPTIEDFYKHITVINNQTHCLSILDTAGMEDYEPLVDEWVEKKHAILLVFSLDLEESFERVEYFYRRIEYKYKKMDKPVVVIVGNKSDLGRKVDKKKVFKYAQRIGCRYFEVSAATGEGIKEMFDEVVMMVSSKRKPSLPWYRRCFIL